MTAFSTTRHGGISQGNYAGLNINRYCGDSPEAIAQNRQLLSRALKGLGATLSVALKTATHPQNGQEIGSIDDDKMEVGMGQHGEGGGGVMPVKTADELYYMIPCGASRALSMPVGAARWPALP